MNKKNNEGLKELIRTLRMLSKEDDRCLTCRFFSQTLSLFMSLLIEQEEITEAMRILDGEEKGTCKNKD